MNKKKTSILIFIAGVLVGVLFSFLFAWQHGYANATSGSFALTAHQHLNILRHLHAGETNGIYYLEKSLQTDVDFINIYKRYAVPRTKKRIDSIFSQIDWYNKNEAIEPIEGI